MKNRRRETSFRIEKKQGFWLGLALLLNIAFLLSLFFGEMGLVNASRLKKVHTELQGEVESLRSSNARLRQEIEALQQDPSVIEHLAREALGLVKEGELVYQFFDSESP